MRFRLIPRDEGFYDLFDEAAANLLDSARLLRVLLDDFGDGSEHLKRIKEHEQRGDDLTSTILRRLHSSFVTPFDREDIHVLTEELDDAVDDIHGAADTLVLHNVRADQIPAEVPEMVDLLIQAAEETVELIQLLPTLKGMEPHLERIDQLESAADTVYRRCVARLFSGEFKAFAVLRAKDTVEAIEASVNSIENISDVVETILLKHA
ncbi:MAG: DUF47 family protein [Acidimicrobiia bacterium]|nr:DUF47 family protein [Acidimicrobiia bacterium]